MFSLSVFSLSVCVQPECVQQWLAQSFSPIIGLQPPLSLLTALLAFFQFCVLVSYRL